MPGFRLVVRIAPLLAAGFARALTPDYGGITLPPNIAPLNFVEKGASEAVMRAADGAELRVAADGAGFVRWPEAAWRRFLAEHAGETVTWRIRRSGSSFSTVTNRIAREPIDSHLTYRLIAPSYRYFRVLGIWQRDLTSFAERPLYRNVQMDTAQCVNCHTYNRADPDEYLFHVRAVAGGTPVVSRTWGERKFALRGAGGFGSGTYPAWHPSGDFIAFSVNQTRQVFYEDHPDRIEVIDLQSDLALLSLADGSFVPIENDPTVFETYPAWHPDGRILYTARAVAPYDVSPSDEVASAERYRAHYRDVRYDLVMRTFDPATRRFSEPRVLVNGRTSGCSVTLPRVSPDGRWLVMTVGPYGCFHIWHRDSDLWLLDLKTMKPRALTELNGADAESYHCFSRNGAWMVFSSRRDDGAYTRPYFAHFDAAAGRFSKPFLLPAAHPQDHLKRMLGYNVPEFSAGPVKKSPREMRALVERPARGASGSGVQSR